MSRLSVLPVTALPNRLGQLMDRYADNYWRLVRLFPLLDLAPGQYRSLASDGIELHLEVIERHSYTLELRLTYGLVDPISSHRDPSAMVRIYTDARLAEVTHCEVSQRWEDLLGLRSVARELVDARMRMNSFLGRWLEYLEERGHSRFTLRAVMGSIANGANEGEATQKSSREPLDDIGFAP
ncbi:MAG: DUF1249 domain-containing protein [Xanthomonadales bacterium]|nr:DUF1249 domain-containing protein [Xanthomonadales bacterium]